MKKIVTLATASAALLMGGAVPAHHSAAMFDYTKLVVLKGTLKTFSYQAPHSWVSMIGAPEEGGEQRQWDAETGAPSTLVRLGLNRDTLKPGDEITMGIHPLRDGRAAGALVYVITPDGKLHGTKPSALKTVPAPTP